MPPCLASESSAARRLSGLSYSNTGGFIGLPLPAADLGARSLEIRIVISLISARTVRDAPPPGKSRGYIWCSNAAPQRGTSVKLGAYYIDYRNRRPDYLKAFVDHLVDWDYVAEMFAAASK